MLQTGRGRFGVLACLIAAYFTVVYGEIQLVEPSSGKAYVQDQDNLQIKVIISGAESDVKMCHKAVGSTSCTEFVVSQTADFKQFKQDSKIIMEYSPKNVGSSVAGVYEVTQGADKKQIQVNFITIEAVDGKLEMENEDVEVECRVKGIQDSYTITWTQYGKVITQMEGIISKNDTLLIESAKAKDVGAYTCVVTPVGSTNNMTATAYIRSAPFVEKFERGKNLVQGDNLVVICHVYGYPLPTVTWLKDQEPLKLDNRTSVSPADGVEGATLHIQELVMEDKADYGCKATNEYNSTVQYITVKVKDKYAALWPFLGICAEVIILCAIIFIYERRRNKKNAEKEKSPEKSPALNGKGDEVRQRNKAAVKA